MSEIKTGPVTLDNAEVGDKVHCTYWRMNGEITGVASAEEGRGYPIEAFFECGYQEYAENGGFFSSMGQCNLFHSHNPEYLAVTE